MIQIKMQLMTNSEMFQVKAGRWYYIDGIWYWYPDDNSLNLDHPEEM